MSQIEELKERHRNFWERIPVKKPILRVDNLGRIDHPPVRAVYGAESGQVIGPEVADAARYLAVVNWDTFVPPGDADLFDVLPPYPRIPWLEAIAGCRVIPQADSDSIWSREPEPPPEKPEIIETNENWLAALKTQAETLGQDESLPCPTAQTLLRGPGDVAEAMLGGQALCYAMLDEEPWLEHFLGGCTELFIRAARAQLESIPSKFGGYFNFFGFFSPEPCVRIQEDVMRILSPDLFGRWLKPCLERIVSEFPYSMFHIHSASLHLLHEVISVPGLKGLEVAVDVPPFGKPIVEQLEYLHTAQDCLPLFVEGVMKSREINTLVSELSPTGLAVRSYLSD